MERLSFNEMLDLVTDRSDALRAAAAKADPQARVPGCPDWTAADLMRHLGGVQMFWAEVVAAGPTAGPPEWADPEPGGDLQLWSAGATATLIAALREAGPDRGCWTWWESSGAPMTAGAVARHQVQEAGVHAFDAEQAAGVAQSVPTAVAADGVGEYLTVELPTNGPWPHDPATVLLSTGAGGNWLIELDENGARPRLIDGDAKADATVTASPSDMVLAFYRRMPHELSVEGDAQLVQRLLDWPNLD
ncbi:MAG TPA: maleylpyruvate isomerase family mycothiol-dependent enzyme [Streptosporangiaceae bacterium]|jgi:uncharacterized protein (TIGR03083 family)